MNFYLLLFAYNEHQNVLSIMIQNVLYDKSSDLNFHYDPSEKK